MWIPADRRGSYAALNGLCALVLPNRPAGIPYHLSQWAKGGSKQPVSMYGPFVCTS